MRSALARRFFTTTLAVVIVGPLTSGFTIHRTESPYQIAPDQASLESVQLQVKDISRSPNDINDGKNEFTSKAAPVRTISMNEADLLEKGSDVPDVAITDIKLHPNNQKVTAGNVNNNETTSPNLQLTQDTEVNSTLTNAISQITQPVTNISIKEDGSNMTTVESGGSFNIDQMTTDSETNADLSTVIDSTISESKSDMTTYTNEITKNGVVDQTAPELTTTEEIVFRNSKTPEMIVTKEVSPINELSTVDNSNPDIDDASPSATTVPSWKKYVTIDRKRTSSEEITTEIVDRDQKPSEISQIVAEAPLELSVWIQNNDTPPSNDTNVQLTTTENKSMEKERIVSSLDADNISKSTIDTKRAGFLDLSKSSSSEPTLTTAKNIEMFEKQATISAAMMTKKASVVESQSQLTEDAINEELLKEEMIINHEENTIRHQKVQQIDDEKQVMEVAPVPSEVNVPQTSTEDTLSVQPINQDRKTTLYTISPNYKPMKKLDIQPSKPFVRDPDDNSWRNESISSLGIVFKPKNATKSFKEVLKNKTETEFLNIPDNKDSKNELPDLRLRLEKIAEVRKSKKKKTYKSGEIIYTDYEENSSSEASSSTTTEKNENIVFDLYNSKSTSLNTETTTPIPFVNLETTTTEKISFDLFKKFEIDLLSTEKPNKYFNAAEYYDTTDEYDADYATLSKLDFKKLTRPYKTTVPPYTSPAMSRYTTKPMSRSRFPDRKPTVQYFPPRATQKVNVDHYDEDFQKKVNYYSSKDNINTKDFFSFTNVNDPIATEKPTTTPTLQFKYTAHPSEMTTKDVYLTTRSRLSSPHGFVLNDGNFNRGSYVIKHYKDFLNEAAQASEFDKIPDFVYPDSPEKVNGLTTSPPLDAGDIPPKKSTENDYDYETEFRKDVLNRFVENFNQNSEKFKIDFPILYNNSIVHEKFDDNGRVASSSAFMKRLYGNEVGTKPSPFSNPRRSCEPNCDMTVELSPAYELHYFVPDQEEKEPPVESPATPPPFNFKL